MYYILITIPFFVAETNMLKEVVSVLAVICGVALVTSTPIFPNHHALGQIDPVDACLFLCNICFDENVSTSYKSFNYRF